MTSALGPSPFEKLFIFDCAPVCGAKAQQTGRTEAYGKNKRQTAQALSKYVHGTCTPTAPARGASSPCRRQDPVGSDGAVLRVGHLVSRRDRNSFAQSMGFGVPAQLHHVYYEWADRRGSVPVRHSLVLDDRNWR
jgi:hypothetical protein